MARGETKAQTQARQIAGTEFGQAQELRGQLVPAYQDIVNKPMSDEERNAIMQATLGRLSGRFDAARQAAENRATRTRNPAGLVSLEDELARSQGREAAQSGFEAQAGLGREAFGRRMAGLGGLGRLYGINEEEMARLLGIAAPRQGRGGFFDTLGAGLGRGIGRGIGGAIGGLF